MSRYVSVRMAREELSDLPAISLYLKFGFTPEIRNDEDRSVWREIQGRLGRQILDAAAGDEA